MADAWKFKNRKMASMQSLFQLCHDRKFILLKNKKKNSKNENTVSKEDRILSWCWEEMEKRGRNF